MSKLHTEKKAPRATVRVEPFQSLRHPTEYVVCPRAHIDYCGHLPWAELRAMAARGERGLSIITQRPHIWQGMPGQIRHAPIDVAYLAQGQYDFREKTVLYLQMWNLETPWP